MLRLLWVFLLALPAPAATLLAGATGNFTAASTWRMASAAAELDSDASNTALTTTYAAGSTFTPGAVEIDALAVKIASRAATPGGTLSVALDQGGSTVPGTEVTVNVSDIDAAGAGWYVFRFASPVNLAGGTAYAMKAKTSAAAQVNLYRDATANNWSRQLRTTAAAPPAAGDKIIVAGELTGQGTGNDLTVTVDSDQSGVSLGAVSMPQSIHVSRRGTLAWSTASAANPKLKWKGVFQVYGGATLSVGAGGAPVPADSTAELIMDVASNVDSGLVINSGATVTIYGAAKTSTQTLLTANAAAGATILAVASTAGWAPQDEIALASTTRTAAECEKRTITTVDSPTQVTVPALTYAHSGTSPTQAEVINLTRNVKIHGAGASLQGYVSFGNTGTVTVRYAEFYWLGSATTNKRGIDALPTTGSVDIQYSSLHDFSAAGSVGFRTYGTAANNITFSNNVGYYLSYGFFWTAQGTSGTAITVSGNVALRGIEASNGLFHLDDVGITFTGNTAIGGATTGIVLSQSEMLGLFSGNSAHSNAGAGIAIGDEIYDSVLSGGAVWRNASYGLTISNPAKRCLIDGLVAFGNASANVNFNNGTALTFRNLVLNGEASPFTTTYGVLVSTSYSATGIVMEDSIFGLASGSKTSHSTADVGAGSLNTETQMVFRNCLLDSPVEAALAAGLPMSSYVASHRHDQTAGNHRIFTGRGVLALDAADYGGHTIPSLRLAPAGAVYKLESAPPGFGAKAAVAGGKTVTVSIRVRKSVAGDGAAYDGSPPRLVVRKNVSAGILSDTVLAVASGPAGEWETLSGATVAVTEDAVLEFVLDADGTAGWVNADDFTASPGLASRGFRFWVNGMPEERADSGGRCASACVQ